AKGKPLMTREEAGAALQGYLAKKQQAAAEKNRSEGAAFLAENRKQKGVITTPSGLQYMVLRQGNGPRPTPSDTVRVNYEGKLLDGTVFDSSYSRGQPAEFPLRNVIAGWTEGVALMPVGAKYRFRIPSDLAYGADGAPGGVIGPDATLTLDVRLLGLAPRSSGEPPCAARLVRAAVGQHGRPCARRGLEATCNTGRMNSSSAWWNWRRDWRSRNRR